MQGDLSGPSSELVNVGRTFRSVVGIGKCRADLQVRRRFEDVMFHRTSVALVLGALVLLVGAVTLAAAPVRLARHPDYHAGRIAFSYLGDIWTANEDGTVVQRLTDNRAREVYPRF